MTQIRRSLNLHAPLRRTPHHVLRTLLAHLPEDTTAEEPVRRLEERVATLLGKQAALLFPTGTMAQQVALRIHAETTGRHTFAAHPQSHLAVHEANGYSVVHGLRLHPLGDPNRLFTAEDLDGVAEPLAALLVELPQRDIGGQVPSWEELEAHTRWAKDGGARAHLDGARLWEAQTAYDKTHAEIAALFDTVYVSLYKGLEGTAGAVLAGDEATIAHARVWRQRLGGSMPDAWPMAAIALVGLEETLPRMAEFRDHAQALARAINAGTPAHTVPEVPCTPLFHVHVPAPRHEVEEAARKLLEREGIQLFHRTRSNPDPRRCSFEVVVGVNAVDFTPDEVAALIGLLAIRSPV
ncbi:threonine aldolase [Lentzea tibetensis]|uniref:Threonine aldolase n=1 Tax=Lentzea tibetensis TaxID=2591470 RepID=A0A563EQ36_9PSEU|nr:beta-eliminating lyase-related protein [Lentzea tibetensis]TWP49506.1 threonine aldolase [Lentzea tibetensis]